MPVPIDAELTNSLIKARFGSIDKLETEWEARVTCGKQCRGSARDRGTIYRWLKNGIPAKIDDLFGFCAALDVDPIAILPWGQDFVAEEFAKARLRFQQNRFAYSNLKPFGPIYLPDVDWPHDETARCLFGRPWQYELFEHDAAEQCNIYAALLMTPQVDRCLPVVFHFAWQRSDSRDRMWRPYGSVIRYKHHSMLISESGNYQTIDSARGSSVEVETYFGVGAARFKVASLHSFELSLNVPSQAKNALRFHG